MAPSTADWRLALYLIGSGLLWSLALTVWMASGFGMAPMVEFRTVPSLLFGAAVSSPLWIAGVSVYWMSSWARVVRIVALLLLVAFFVGAGKYVCQDVVFVSLLARPPLIFWGNVLLFRAPFVLAFIATIVLAARVISELRKKLE